MDRNEAVLRELNLYPQWVRKDRPAPVQNGVTTVGAIHESPKQPVAMTTDRAIDITTSHSTKLANNASQVAGYHELPLHWPELKQQVRDCTICKLRAGCTQTVFGVGDERAEWLFVGEGPGADEDARGEPFVGQAGKLLDNMLLAIKLRRGKNVYIANIVKCRPPGNRTPEADEIAACLPYLQRQIELIKPKLIVALGKTAATALLGRDATLGSLRGTLHDYRASATDLSSAQGCESSRQPPLPHQTTSSHRVGAATPLLVTYHPAYLLRSPMEKAKAWQDLCLATDMMQKMSDAIQKL